MFTFRGENDAIIIKSQNSSYNDDYWHFIELQRDASKSRLSVDDKDISESVQKAVLDISTPFYFGGIPPENSQFQENLVSKMSQICLIAPINISLLKCSRMSPHSLVVA